jgi:hypothetical protein
MAEATNKTFEVVNAIGSYREAIVTAVVSENETITLDDAQYAITEIISAQAFANHQTTPYYPVYSIQNTQTYSGKQLTRQTAGTDVADVIKIVYR